MTKLKKSREDLKTLKQFVSRLDDLEYLFRFSEHPDESLVEYLATETSVDCEDALGMSTNELWGELQRLQCDYGLAFDYVRSGTFDDQEVGYFRYQLSFGGPTEEFRFYADPEHNLINAEFWLLDWFTGSSIECATHETVVAVWDYFRDVDITREAFSNAMAA